MQFIIIDSKTFQRSIFLLFAIFTFGCSSLKSPPPLIDYYTIEYPPPTVSTNPKLSAILKIDRLSLSPIYQKLKLIYKEEDYTRNPYIYHQWLADPGEMIAHFIARDFAMTESFQGIFYPEIFGKSSHQLKGNVEEILEIDDSDTWKARLSLHMVLLDNTRNSISDRVLFQKFYTHEIVCENKTPLSFVKALSRCLQKISLDLVEDTYQRILKDDSSLMHNR